MMSCIAQADAVAGDILHLLSKGTKKTLNASFFIFEGSYKFLKKRRANNKAKRLNRGQNGRFVSVKPFKEMGNFNFSYYRESSLKISELEFVSQKAIENMIANAGINGFKSMSIRNAPSFVTYVVSLKEGVVPPTSIKNNVFELEDERIVSIEKPRYNHNLNAYVLNVVISKTEQDIVSLESMLTSKEFWSFKGDLVLPIGKNEKGYIFSDLAKLPHLLVAGTTGSGKSTAVDAMLVGLMHRVQPQDLKLLLIDPKRVAFNLYKDIEGTAVVTEMAEALVALQAMVTLMERRYETFEEKQVKELKEYNALGLEHMERYVIVVDELADLMATNGEEVSFVLGRLAQKSRAAGIHLILATQRPTTSVIKGNIKANIVARLSFQLKTATDSITILGEGGAEKLNGQGDGYFSEGGKKVRLKSPFIENSNIKKILL